MSDNVLKPDRLQRVPVLSALNGGTDLRLVEHKGMAAAALLALLLCACGGQGGPEGPFSQRKGMPPLSEPRQTEPAAPVLSELPQLPADPYFSAEEIESRRSQAFRKLSLKGIETSARSSNCATNNTFPDTLNVPKGGVLGWAMYRYELLRPDDMPGFVTLSLVDSLPADVWAAYSDYSAGRWQLLHLNVSEGGVSFPLPAGSTALSPSGSLYLAFLASGHSMAIEQLDLSLDMEFPPPEMLQAQSQSGDRIHLSWRDPALSYDPDGSGPLHFDYMLVAVYRAEMEGAWELLQTVPKGTTSYDDICPGPGQVPLYGKAYRYCARTVALEGSGPVSCAVQAARTLARVSGLSASNGSSGKSIYLAWDPQPDVSFSVLARYQGQGEFQWINRVETNSYSTGRQYWDYGAAFEFEVRAEVSVPGGWETMEPSEIAVGMRKWPELPNLSATQGDFDDRVELSWDPSPEAFSYRIWCRKFGEASFNPSEIVDSPPYIHSAQSAFPCELNVTYEYAVTVYNNLDEAQPGGFVSGYRNWKPVAVLELSVDEGPAPLSVDFDAGSSTDFNGSGILAYEWDFEGDGAIDLITGPSEPGVSHVYSSPGFYVPSVAVSNAEAERSTARRSLNCGGWTHSFGGSFPDRGSAVASDPAGNVYCAGQLGRSPDGMDCLVLLTKYDSAGQLLWRRIWDGGGVDWAMGLSADAAGACIVTSCRILRFNANGSLAWSKQGALPPGQTYLKFVDACGDGFGNCYIAARFLTIDLDESEALFCVDQSGAVSWAKDLNPQARLHSIRCSGSELVLSAEALDAQHLLLLRSDTSGNILWQADWQLGDYAFESDACFSPDGGLGIVTAAGGLAPTMLKLDAANNVEWQRQFWKFADKSQQSSSLPKLAFASDGRACIGSRDNWDSLFFLVGTNGALLHTLSAEFELTKLFTLPDGSISLSGAAPSRNIAWSRLPGYAEDQTAQLQPGSLSLDSFAYSFDDVSGTVSTPAGVKDNGAGQLDLLCMKFAP